MVRAGENRRRGAVPARIDAGALANGDAPPADRDGAGSVSESPRWFCRHVVRGRPMGTRDLKRYRDDSLGYLGREVAEHLIPLLARGYRVFVPAKGKSDFNLDHVAVGPVVSRSSRQRHCERRAIPGREDCVVTYDGNKLIWPWGSENRWASIRQQETDWLGKFVSNAPASRLSEANSGVARLLGGSKGRGPVAVVNSTSPVKLKVSGPQFCPTNKSTDCSQLEVLCRDVELSAI